VGNRDFGRNERFLLRSRAAGDKQIFLPGRSAKNSPSEARTSRMTSSANCLVFHYLLQIMANLLILRERRLARRVL
jgi:hypothetical protein